MASNDAWSPVLRLATSQSSFRHHIRMPSGKIACGVRVLVNTAEEISLNTFVEQFSDKYVCAKCLAKASGWRA